MNFFVINYSTHENHEFKSLTNIQNIFNFFQISCLISTLYDVHDEMVINKWFD